MRLQPPGFGAFHVFPDSLYPGGVHGIGGQRAVFQELPESILAQGIVNDGGEPRLDFGPFAVTDRLDQQLP